jgi:hypothetical protein
MVDFYHHLGEVRQEYSWKQTIVYLKLKDTEIIPRKSGQGSNLILNILQ